MVLHLRLAAELAMVGSLARLISGKPDVPAGTTAFTCHRQSAPVMWLMAGLIAIETAVLHLVVPWPTVQLVLVILSLYSLLWVVGFIAGFKVYPHLLSDDSLTLRHGPRASIEIPRSAIGEIAVREDDLPGMRSVRYEPAQHPDGEHVLHIAQAGRTNIVVALTAPLPGARLTKDEPVTRVLAWVDDPRALQRRVQTPSPDTTH